MNASKAADRSGSKSMFESERLFGHSWKLVGGGLLGAFLEAVGVALGRSRGAPGSSWNRVGASRCGLVPLGQLLGFYLSAGHGSVLAALKVLLCALRPSKTVPKLGSLEYIQMPGVQVLWKPGGQSMSKGLGGGGKIPAPEVQIFQVLGLGRIYWKAKINSGMRPKSIRGLAKRDPKITKPVHRSQSRYPRPRDQWTRVARV